MRSLPLRVLRDFRCDHYYYRSIVIGRLSMFALFLGGLFLRMSRSSSAEEAIDLYKESVNREKQKRNRKRKFGQWYSHI